MQQLRMASVRIVHPPSPAHSVVLLELAASAAVAWSAHLHRVRKSSRHAQNHSAAGFNQAMPGAGGGGDRLALTTVQSDNWSGPQTMCVQLHADMLRCTCCQRPVHRHPAPAFCTPDQGGVLNHSSRCCYAAAQPRQQAQQEQGVSHSPRSSIWPPGSGPQ